MPALIRAGCGGSLGRGPRAHRQPLPQLSIAELSPARPWVSWKHCVCPESPDGLLWEGLKDLTWFTPLDDVIAVWFSISASGLMDRAVHREPCLASQEAQLLPPQMSEPLVSEGDAQELRQVLCTHRVTMPLHGAPSCLHTAPRCLMLAPCQQGLPCAHPLCSLWSWRT